MEGGLVDVSDIDKRLISILKLLEKTGKFTDRRPTPKEQAINLPEHQALIREAGSEGLVLLKNQNNILPLDLRSTKKIALLGPLAKYAAAHGGGSASLNCHYKITPFDAFTKRLGSKVELTHSKGAHIFRVYPELEQGTSNNCGNPGFTAEYFMNTELKGKPFHTGDFPRGYFTTLMDTAVTGAQSVRFSTAYRPTQSGTHYLSFSGIGPSRLYINEELIAEQKCATKDSMAFLLGVQEEIRFQYPFETSRIYNIRIETVPSSNSNSELYLMDDQISVHLGFVPAAEMELDLRSEAVALAQEADLAIIFVGNTTQWETEGQDLSAMVLPADGSQDGLIRAVAAINPNTIVINTTGVPVELPWLDDVAAFIQAWYAGQETGNSILDVLLGEVNPSGKLPISWPRKYEHTACYGNFGLDSFESREVEYVEGVFVGYKHFDRHWDDEKRVLFPFGYGLSYTTFDVRDTKLSGKPISDPNAKVHVTAKVQNTGRCAGAETVQIYIAPPQTKAVKRPTKELAGYSKVLLDTSEEKTVEVTFSLDTAAYWDERVDKWRVVAGKYEILVATSTSPNDVKERLSFVVEEEFTFDP